MGIKKLFITTLLMSSLLSLAAAEKGAEIRPSWWGPEYDLLNTVNACNLPEVERLLAEGVDPNQSSPECCSNRLADALYSYEPESVAIVNALIGGGARVNGNKQEVDGELGRVVPGKQSLFEGFLPRYRSLTQKKAKLLALLDGGAEINCNVTAKIIAESLLLAKERGYAHDRGVFTWNEWIELTQLIAEKAGAEELMDLVLQNCEDQRLVQAVQEQEAEYNRQRLED